MKVVVYGLGIIGASFAAALRRAGHTVLGKNRSRKPIEIALARGMIDAEAKDYAGCDAVILALPPEPVLRELDERDFPEGVVVSDICGVKEIVEARVFSKPRRYRYVGMHPMAGKETSGIASADADLFCGKNLVITVCAKTDPAALSAVKTLAADAGFGRIVITSAKEHDKKIALTSQLAHIVSNAYIKSPGASDVTGFTGGSFQDMTRVGGVDEALWSSLYLANRLPLLNEIEGLIARLGAYADALRAEDREKLVALLREGRLAHESHFSEK